MSDPDDAALDRILAEQVYCGSGYKPFREMTLAEVESRATELRSAAGFGPTERVASVASVWEGLAEAMRRQPAATVADLERETLASRADRLWVVPPGGSFL
jgi:hypothetical protein